MGTNQLTIVSENYITLGAANVGLLGPNYLSPSLLVSFQPLEGLFSAILQAGEFNDNPPYVPVSIAQTGLISSWAKAVLFEGTLQLAGTNFLGDCAVTVGGVNTPVVPLGGDLYGCNISAFAGLEEELSFSMLTNYGNGLMYLDTIRFSGFAVPEPSALSLVMMAAAGLGLWRVVSRKKS